MRMGLLFHARGGQRDRAQGIAEPRGAVLPVSRIVLRGRQKGIHFRRAPEHIRNTGSAFVRCCVVWCARSLVLATFCSQLVVLHLEGT